MYMTCVPGHNTLSLWHLRWQSDESGRYLCGNPRAAQVWVCPSVCVWPSCGGYT